MSLFPKFEPSCNYDFKQLDGSLEIEVESKSQSSGWVASSYGNFTTSTEKTLKFKNKIKYEQTGARKIIKQKVKTKTRVMVVSESGSTVSQTTVKRTYYPYNLNVARAIYGYNLDDNC